MANKDLFRSTQGPAVDTENEAGGEAFQMSAEQALAQFAVTGTFADNYYTSAEEQLVSLMQVLPGVDSKYIAQVAIYARDKGFMKDMPAFLVAYLTTRSEGFDDNFEKAFLKVIDNGRMLRTFVQILRSGVVGRKNPSARRIKDMIQYWFDHKSDDAIFKWTVGNDPSMADIIKMVHPKPATKARNALYGYVLGREHTFEDLPPLVQQYENYKINKGEVPDVPFQMLDGLSLDDEGWKQIAQKAKWMMTRMNLNTFLRHGVFNDPDEVAAIAARLEDPLNVEKARAFPYQLFIAYKSISSDMPFQITEALQNAMELATKNVPAFGGKVWVFPDVSGSMASSVMGWRGSATSAAECVDIAALIASVVLRQNKDAGVLPFNGEVVDVRLNPRDSVMTNAKKLADLCSNGTDCSVPLRRLNLKKEKGDLIIYVSDNESWMDSGRYGSTASMEEWRKFKKRNPKAKMVCIDIEANDTTQAKGNDILNIGGFSDNIWGTIKRFVDGVTPDAWIKEIKEIEV